MKKTKAIRIIILLSLVVMLEVPVISIAQAVIKVKASPTETAERMINNPVLKKLNGEDFCWNAAAGIDVFVNNYELTKNTEWLDAGVKYYDFLIGKMDTDPDGYKGWIGVYGYDDKYYQDALVGDAIVIEGMLDFSVLVLENPVLKSKYGEKANAYVKLAARDLIEKYDKRGCWIEDGPYGGYVGFNKYLKEGNLKEWIYGPKVDRSGLSHPFNKQLDVGSVCLRLWRVTGNKFYRDRAEKIYFTEKSHFQYFDNHYCWNYFDPLYPGDVNVKRNTTLHFVDVHPWRSGYQTGEVEKIAEAYHYGIVFDEQDIKRIINTNLNVMWNKDKVNPKYICSNGLGADGDTVGVAAFKKTYGHSNVTKYGGELWTGLLDFDQTIRDLYELRFNGDKTSERYLRYKNTVLVNPPSFKRKYAKGKITVPKIDFTECKDLYLATVLPHEVKKNENSVIICKTRVPGDLQIDVYTTKNKKIANLYNGKIKEGFYTMTWDGKDPAGKNTFKGEYKIRWTTSGGCREFPVVVD
jgi:hypothetical protein